MRTKIRKICRFPILRFPNLRTRCVPFSAPAGVAVRNFAPGPWRCGSPDPDFAGCSSADPDFAESGSPDPDFWGSSSPAPDFMSSNSPGPDFGQRLSRSRFRGRRLRLPEGGELPDLLPASARVGETSIFVDRFVHLRLTDWLNPPTEGHRLPLSGFGLRFRARHPSPVQLPAPISGNCPICPLSAFAVPGPVVRIRILPDRTLLFSLCRIRPVVYIVLSFFVSLPNM